MITIIDPWLPFPCNVVCKVQIYRGLVLLETSGSNEGHGNRGDRNQVQMMMTTMADLPNITGIERSMNLSV
jgi:hypothetical protein